MILSKFADPPAQPVYQDDLFIAENCKKPETKVHIVLTSKQTKLAKLGDATSDD
jgi:diadenosine tetraphosphate (Ap4A) HIT family hydrolase